MTEVKNQISIGDFKGGQSLNVTSVDELYRVSKVISNTNFVPKEYKNKPDEIFTSILFGLEIGLKPIQSLQSICVINGKPTVYGDTQLALVRNSGQLIHFKEYYTGEEDTDNFTAVCEVKRVGDTEIHIEKYSIADAKKAGLFSKPGPWTTHRKRMLRYKPRSFALRDKFPDILKGLHSTEEMIGEEVLDVTPKSKTSHLMDSEFTESITEQEISQNITNEIPTEIISEILEIPEEQNQNIIPETNPDMFSAEKDKIVELFSKINKEINSIETIAALDTYIKTSNDLEELKSSDYSNYIILKGQVSERRRKLQLK